MSDFNFEETRTSSKKIDYKEVFFNPKEGTNLLRIVDLKKGKSFKVHYVQDINKKYVFVKSPGAGDPLIVQGIDGVPSIPRTRYYLKVIERDSNKVKIWEFGSQIKQQIEEFVADLKEKRAKGATDEEDVLTNYNIEMRKRKPGSNPLYMLSVRDRITDQKVLSADAALIAADEIDFEPLLKPWSIERIKQQILGIGEGDAGAAKTQAPAPRLARALEQELRKSVSASSAISDGAKKVIENSAAVKVASTMAKAAASDDSWLDED